MPKIFARFVCCILLALFTGFIGCSPSVGDLKQPNLGSFQVLPTDLSLTLLADDTTADGVSFNEILFKGGSSVTSSYTSVSFSISPIGLFSNDSVRLTAPIDANGEARVFVFSRTPGTATVIATVGGLTKQATTNFAKAWPDQLLIQPDSTFLPPLPGAWSKVTASLVRSTGKANSGEFVSFSDSTAASGASVGVFLNTVTSDSSGKASSQYWLQDTSYHGYVYIKGFVITPAGKVAGAGRIKIR